MQQEQEEAIIPRPEETTRGDRSSYVIYAWQVLTRRSWDYRKRGYLAETGTLEEMLLEMP